MGKRNSKRHSKKNKSRDNSSQVNPSQSKEENPEQLKYEGIYETTSQDSVEDGNEIQNDSSASKTSLDTGSETPSPPPPTTTTDINDSCEEIKAKQQELFDKLKNISEAFTDITLIRDNVNSIRVDTLTELYFTRQVRPLLDALNIIAFSSYNMSSTATAFQLNAFGDRKEIKDALKLSYKMNNEVDDIITALGRRLTIFLKQIDCMDKNCPPFDSGKDS
ncbi:hypothetical protein psyc5s11_12940 [Clostridium gelidum]|uniref:Uncharacterized protein n=1 Tax=Clostridium gelidum TaxID=704125 RepID=A0ABM7T8I3_9CLOT|nr:hypothetical protein [Clostridium gelidum]BCZ45227.1 hypothetical protein psyc5s11_12940 [Clostridium gelidum]